MSTSNQITRFGFVGGGWRTEAYLNVAQAMPDSLAVTGMVVRDAGKGAELEAARGVSTFRTIDEMLEATSPDYVVTSVPWPVNPQSLKTLSAAGVPALSETPPAPDLEGLLEVYQLVVGGARIQVAEQYSFQPLNAARLALASSGRLGTISQAQVSVAHGYHGISLMRRLLGIGFENCTISGRSFTSPLVAGAGRDGPPTEEKLADSHQQLLQFDFGDRLGVFDFTGDQYFSWIRNERLLVRGERGEIIDESATWLANFETPITADFVRSEAGQRGNLEGHHLKGIQLGSEWIYNSPCGTARLADDEIAIATCLLGMGQYLRGGPEIYSLAEACQDHYLVLLGAQAIEAGTTVASQTQPWAQL